MPHDTAPVTTPRVGVVGAGQLARMMGEAARDAGVRVVVLAHDEADAAVATCDESVIGEPDDEGALRSLAARCDVVTFDHELVDLEVLARLEREGVLLRPGPAALRFAVDKAFQRRAFDDAGVPVPRFLVVGPDDESGLERFLDLIGGPPVVKAARGGYDGRGVHFPAGHDEARTLIDELRATGEVVVEERLALRGEVAHVVARALGGAVAEYPVVATLQRDGMCVEVRYPSGLGHELLASARELSERVAAIVAGVGILAIEYFVTDEGLVVNEVALRPHNTGHWTIEGAATSQFVQHLRAVSGQSLGDVAPLAAHAVMVNLVGGPAPSSTRAAEAIAGVHVHDYGKAWRPGRKLGHVTALGEDEEGPHVRAWESARAYGTSTREADTTAGGR